MKAASIVAAAILLSLGSCARADTLALWTFDANLPAPWTFNTGLTAQDAGPFAAESGSGSAYGHHSSTGSIYSAPAGFSSYRSFSASRWAVGDYFQFNTTSVGYENLSFSFDVTGSVSGPRDFKIAYSTDGTTYTDFGTYQVSIAFTHVSFDFSSVLALDDSPAVYFRLIDTSTVAVLNPTVGTSGTNRIDNVTVTASAIPAQVVPLPAAALAGPVLLGLLAVARRRGART